MLQKCNILLHSKNIEDYITASVQSNYRKITNNRLDSLFLGGGGRFKVKGHRSLKLKMLNEGIFVVFGADGRSEEAQCLFDEGQRFVARCGNGGGHRPQLTYAELGRQLRVLHLLIVAALFRVIALLLNRQMKIIQLNHLKRIKNFLNY